MCCPVQAGPPSVQAAESHGIMVPKGPDSIKYYRMADAEGQHGELNGRNASRRKPMTAESALKGPEHISPGQSAAPPWGDRITSELSPERAKQDSLRAGALFRPFRAWCCDHADPGRRCVPARRDFAVPWAGVLLPLRGESSAPNGRQAVPCLRLAPNGRSAARCRCSRPFSSRRCPAGRRMRSQGHSSVIRTHHAPVL